ncbi:hypothetical protein OAF98_01230 [Planctomicrobium sp.]|jgi:hypothetical protein|nr:hypothetical protein [Planctomicrobium sp.]MDA7528181.1 hypothetical protein [bacterium]MDB4743083.1 hypothetical protein [Planctomicrobium sp.]
MPRNTEARVAFADFLTRLATGDDADWEKYIVAHYEDDFLEEMRRCVMRMRHYSNAVWGDTDSNNMLRHWANALQLSTNTEISVIDSSRVKLTVTASEFVVLDSILRRFSETDDFTVNDAVERQTLYNLQCLCEKYDAHSMLPEIQDARQELSPD